MRAPARDQLADAALPVGRLVSTNILTCDCGATVQQAAAAMRERGCGCVLVTDAEQPLAGIFTERDLLMRVVGAGLDPARVPVGEVMTRDPVCFDSLMPVAEAVSIMTAHGFRHAPVTEDGRLMGLVSARDLLRARERHLEARLDQEIRSLQEMRDLLALDAEQRVRALVQVNRRLEELALTDEMTGLYNYRYFSRRLQEEAVRARRHGLPLSLVFADLDFFKSVNDTHGHQVGDQVLRAVAGLLRDAVEGTSVVVRLRKTEVVARYGGEEFAVLLPSTRAGGGRVVADRIRRGIEQLRVPLPGGGDLKVTISAGVATLPDHAIDGEGLLRAADQALYRAKDAGRNAVVVAEPLPGAVARLRARAELDDLAEEG